MKEKKLILTSKDITQKQWSNLILELNLIKKAWKRYGVDATLKTPNLNKIISQGTSNGEKSLHYKKNKKNHIKNIFG